VRARAPRGDRRNRRPSSTQTSVQRRASINKNDKKLAKVTEVCLALPGAERRLSGSHATYLVRKKVFAYFLDDHHGDGIVSVCVKSELGENVDRVRRDPERYYLPAYIGPRGWFGLRLDRGRVDWREVANVVERSYRLTAPKTLAAKLDAAAKPRRGA
jgi:predicted DNA-binding protein (MmcQ/YjbR family)